MMKKILKILIICMCTALLPACSSETEEGPLSGAQPAVSEGSETDSPEEHSGIFAYRYASREEGEALMMSNTEYYAGFSQNELDYKYQETGADMESYLAFARAQVREFIEPERDAIDGYFALMEKKLEENHIRLPDLDEIVLIKTTMMEEDGAGAYTHGTQIYLSSRMLNACAADPGNEYYTDYMLFLLWHELFHCLTRRNPEFRKDMYSLIHFTVADHDFELPPGVFEYHISNPDTEHHNAYATFRINGEDIDCFTDFVTRTHFQEKGDSFFDTGTAVLIPVDGSDQYYLPEEAENFYDIFGRNTDYVIDPEECMADNFAYAMNYGMEGKDGSGYPDPEIIRGILDYLKEN